MQPTFSGAYNVVHTSAEAPLGFRHTIPASVEDIADDFVFGDRGDMELIYVYNDSGSTISAGELVARKTRTDGFHARTSPIDAPKSTLLGMALFDIADGEYGFILKRGKTDLLQCEVADLRDLNLATGGSAGRAYAQGATDAIKGPIGQGAFNNTGSLGDPGAAYIDL